MNVQNVIDITRRLTLAIDRDVNLAFDTSQWFVREVVIVALSKGQSKQTVEVSMEETANAKIGSNELRSRLENAIGQLS